MPEYFDDPETERKFLQRLKFIVGKQALCIVSKARFEKLPMDFRTAGPSKGQQVLAELGSGVVFSDGKVYAYSSEKVLVSAFRELRKHLRVSEDGLTNVVVSPTFLVGKLQTVPAESLIVDYGTMETFAVGSEELQAIEDLGLIAKLGQLPSIFVVQEANGFALSMEIEGQEYALGFLNEEDAAQTLEGLAKSSPGCKLEPNKPRALALNVLSSEFQGLVLNAATSSQKIVSKSDLKKLIISVDQLSGAPTGLLGSFKRLFS